MNAKGSVFKYPDNVDTDVIIPARHLNTQDAKELASHCMEDIDKDFVKKVKDGDIIDIDIPARTINVRLSDDELAARPQQPLTRDRKVSKALRAYAQSVSSADKGGVRII